MKALKVIKEQLSKAERIAIFAHVIPDADAYGSALVWSRYVKKVFGTEKHVDIFVDNNGKTAALYESLFIDNTASLNPEQIQETYDLAFAFDCASVERLGKYQEIFKSAGFKVNIDHHTSNTMFGDVNIVEDCSSTCEILYNLFKKDKFEVKNGTAGLIYGGVITDSLNLSVGTSQDTYRLVADLCEKTDTSRIAHHYFKNISQKKLELIGEALKNIKYLFKDRLALMSLTQRDVKYYDAQFEDTLGIIDLASNVQGVDIAAMIIEKDPSFFYVSLRSRGDISVLEIAKKFKGGGNNDNMAAFQYKGDLNDLIDAISAEARHQFRLNPVQEDGANPFAESHGENPTDGDQ